MRPLFLQLFILVSTSTTIAFSPSILPTRPQSHISGISVIGINTLARSSASCCYRRRIDSGRFVAKRVNKSQSVSSPCLYMSATPAASASTKARQFAYKKRIAIIMAFMTGWADFIFIKKYNYFPTMMSGNSLKMSYAMIDGRIQDSFFFLSIILSYMMGAGIFRRAELSYKDKALNGLFAPLVTICFVMSDYLSWMNPSSKFVPAILLSLAWGIINSVGSEVTGTLIFVVTGALVSLMNARNEVVCMC